MAKATKKTEVKEVIEQSKPGTPMPVQELKAEPNFYDRLLIEKEQLEEKTVGLKTFIDSNPVYGKLDQVQKNLMLIQLKSMEQYLDCLDRREMMLRPAVEETAPTQEG